MLGNLTMETVLIAVSGIVIVFLMLTVLCLLIPAISRIVCFFEMRAKGERDVSQISTVQPVQIQRSGSSGGSVMLIDVDEKTAACIMAIVSHETGIPLAELNFRRIQAL